MCPIGTTKFTWIEKWDIFKFDCKIQFSKVLSLKTKFLWNWSLLENSQKARFLSVCFHVLVSRAFPQLLDPQHEQASLLFEPRQRGINAKLPQNYCFWCVVTNFTFTTGELEILILFCVGQRFFVPSSAPSLSEIVYKWVPSLSWNSRWDNPFYFEVGSTSRPPSFDCFWRGAQQVGQQV